MGDKARTFGLLSHGRCEMKPNDMIFGHEFFCVGGVTIHGVIGTRDYNKMTTYETARKLYIHETDMLQAYLGFTDDQLKNETKHRTNETYRML